MLFRDADSRALSTLQGTTLPISKYSGAISDNGGFTVMGCPNFYSVDPPRAESLRAEAQRPEITNA